MARKANRSDRREGEEYRLTLDHAEPTEASYGEAERAISGVYRYLISLGDRSSTPDARTEPTAERDGESVTD